MSSIHIWDSAGSSVVARRSSTKSPRALLCPSTDSCRFLSFKAPSPFFQGSRAIGSVAEHVASSSDDFSFLNETRLNFF